MEQQPVQRRRINKRGPIPKAGRYLRLAVTYHSEDDKLAFLDLTPEERRERLLGIQEQKANYG